MHEAFPEIQKALSCVTRPMRPGEAEGKTYHFISNEEFDERAQRGEFLEWIEKYGGIKYGTLKEDILKPLREGGVVEREVDIDGVKALLELLPRENLFILMIDAGDWEVANKRIKDRSELSDVEYETRKARFFEEYPYFTSVADAIIINRDGAIEEAQQQVHRVISEVLQNHQQSSVN